MRLETLFHNVMSFVVPDCGLTCPSDRICKHTAKVARAPGYTANDFSLDGVKYMGELIMGCC